ncbi:MAG: response regulator transcription factor [Candidatus Hydrogenedentes bacterium]|nr:response regulator transcription factor [Candidatus Hydrogenedentota bacterium]
MTIKIAIADDHAVFRSGLRALLEKEADFDVIGEAGSGEETLKMLESRDSDILILDINMPGLSGSKLAERVLKKYPRLAIVILTMHEDEHYLQELFRTGVRGYVLKKSTGTDLLQALRAAYRGEKYIDPALVDLVVSPYVGKPVSKDSGRLGLLTDREKEVCRLLACGYSHSRVADKLCISPRTVESHRSNIMTKLGLENRADLIHFAMSNGLL